jgi:glycosyltransferase involved in cell wall biosynthesis
MLAGYVSGFVIDRKVRHLHSHFASGSTRLAKYVHLITGVPFSFTAHAKDIFSDRVSQKQLKRRMEKAKFVVTITEYNRRYLKGILENARILIIRNGISLKKFSPNGRNAMSERVPIILAVGRFVEKKGFSCLVDACGELKRQQVNCRVVIVGDGPLRGEIEDQIRRMDLQDRVRLEGSRTHDELIDKYYRRATLFVLPCKEADNKDKDGLPVVLEEAMAMGIPVVTTPIAGIPELVRHNQTGLLVPPENPDELARSIKRLLTDDSLRWRLTMTARKIIEDEYDIESSSGQLADLFAEAVCES